VPPCAAENQLIRRFAAHDMGAFADGIADVA
jgi:hypothetical protein